MSWLARLLRRIPRHTTPSLPADAPAVDVAAAADIAPVAPITIGLREFDLVTLVFYDSVHWAVRDRQTGEEHAESNWREHHVPGGQSILATLVPWLSERAGGRPALVRAFSAELRRSDIAELLGSGQVVLADLLACRSSQAWADTSRAQLARRRDTHFIAAAEKKHTPPQEPRARRTPPPARTIYAASDGSKHPRGRDYASAWVTNTGEFEISSGRGTISHAELHAAVGFLRWFHDNRAGSNDRAVLFVDRMETFDVLTGTKHVSTYGEDDAVDAVDLVRKGFVEVVWVRGHADNPLNDLADRIALQKYRGLRGGFPHDQTLTLCARIVADACSEFAGIQWTKVAKAARIAHRQHSERHVAAHV